MNLFIEKLKVSNFLSFLGEYEVNLKPFSAVMCNFYEGKDDLFRAFEFVFGAKLDNLRVESPLDLVHKVLREEFLINRDVHTYVEVTLTLTQEKKQIKLCRSVKNGANNPRIEHKISDLVTSSLLYEEKLNSLGVFVPRKNLTFHKSYFNNIIWGSPEDLEMTISSCLRENYLLEDWRKANREVEQLTRVKNAALRKNFTSMRKSHSVVANFTKKYQISSANRESVTEEILRDFQDDSSHESSISLMDYSEEAERSGDTETPKKLSLEREIDVLVDELHDLKSKAAVLTSRLYHEEIKLAAKPVNAILLQNRISLLKTELQDKEKEMSEIQEEIEGTESELESISRRISLTLISLGEIHRQNFRKNCFTPYGRFYDYLQPSRFTQLLKQIIGNDIFYAHICDSVQEACQFLDLLKGYNYEHREVFIPLENYSHKLKDLITASGEKGIQINTLEELLIFLCKLHHYEFINEVPVIVQRNFDFDASIPNDFTIYVEDDFHFTSDGIISRKVIENGFCMDSEEKLKTDLFRLYTEEEIKYQKLKDLMLLSWATLVEMSSLEEDVFCLKKNWRKSTQKPHPERELSMPADIYEDYSEIFKEYDELRKQLESESQDEESFLTEGDSSASYNEDSLNVITKDLEDVITEKIKTGKLLQDLVEQKRSLDVTPFQAPTFRKYTIIPSKSKDRRTLFFEKEFRSLKKFMREDDLEDFLGNQEWRKAFITALIKDFDDVKAKLKASTTKLQNISTERKRRLYQLFDHCSRHLSTTFSNILGNALPFVKINFSSREESIQILSCLGEEKINVADINHFNTLFRFISALSIFLEIAKFDKIPVMILDDMEEYFPLPDDDLQALLGEDTQREILPEKENSRFHLLMRLGQYLKQYIKKNIPSNHVRNNGNYKDYTNGPMQIIYFVKEDFIHAAEHCVWIQNQILPDEYITEHCDSYSEIHEINLKDLNFHDSSSDGH